MPPPTSNKASNGRRNSLPRRVAAAIQTTFRNLGLQIAVAASRWNSPEEPKVALYHNRTIALLHTLLHAPALAGAIILLVWNIQGHYVGRISTTTLSSLQFVAKLFEVLLQTSLATIVIAFVRQQALGDSGLPLGGLLAPAHTTQISYLWTLDLWGSLTSKHFRSFRNCWLALLIVLVIILGSLVGPSGAVLLIPRTGRLPMDKMLFFADPLRKLFPTTVGEDRLHVL
jgi:hypothetical protein